MEVGEMETDENSFRNYLLHSKWVSTVASIWIQCTSGSLYTFSTYSQTLKSTQHYDQSTLDLISVFKDIGANTGVLSGLLYDFVANRQQIGPWVILLAGAVQCFLGYFLIWASVSGLISRPPVPAMCLFMLIAAHAQNFFNTSNVVTGVRNFPICSGTIVGILKGFLGLSGAILIQVYQTIFNNNPSSYLLLLALLPPINTLLLMWFVRFHNTNEGDEKRHLNSFSLISIMVAAYLMVVIIIEHIISLNLSVRICSFIVLLLLLASPLFVALRAQIESVGTISRISLHERNPLVTEESGMEVEGTDTRRDSFKHRLFPFATDQENDDSDQRALQSQPNLNLSHAICTVAFWILFFAMACGMGSGLATVNNISQVGGSLGYKNRDTGMLVSLWSIWNFLGRFGAGYVSDYFLHTRGWARPLFMVITLFVMSIGHVVIATGLSGALYIGSILVGVCYGSQWSLMPTIISEIFGIGHMGTIFNTITMASPLGSYIFSVRVVGSIYDKEASSGNTCFGTHCFMVSFLIMSSATLLGSLAALCLYFRTKSFYRQVFLRRLS